MSPAFLIEIGVEELPANACVAARAQAPALVERLLAERRLAPSGVRALVAPRRIAVVADDVPAAQAAERLEHRGPPEGVAFGADGAPTPAGAGFARKHGLDPGALIRREGFVWAISEADERPAAEVLPEVVDGLVAGLQFPKNMRWGTSTLRFARPIRWLVALHGADVVPVEIGAVRSGRVTRGHRNLSGEPLVGGALELPDAGAYVETLRAAFVLVDEGERRAAITAGLDALDASWSDPAGALDEVVDLAEWPTPLRGAFDRRFLELPARVLVTAMQSHQRYFPIAEADGSLAPGFLFVAGADPAAAATIAAGNERVLHGRLDDAAFSFERDLARGLDGMAASLERITFHARAGSLADKTARNQGLVAALAEAAGVTGAEREHALEAARLAKADLASTLVGEFAELQGFAGETYARRAGLPEPVAQAIGQHYRPEGAGAALPEAVPGALVAVADRLDSLTVAFALGEQPTGSRDPYGLRRAAAGVAAIALERGWHVHLEPLVAACHAQLVEQGARLAQDAATTAGEVSAFVLDRVDALLESEGIGFDLVRASRGAGGDDPLAHARRARALAAHVDEPVFDDVHTAYTRAHRLAAKGGADAAPALIADAFEDETERVLAAALEDAGGRTRSAAADGRWDDALAAAAGLRAPLDAFFDAVLVMHDDERVRANRLRLLVDVTDTLRPLGDFSAVQR